MSGADRYHVTYTSDGGHSWHAPVANHRAYASTSLTFSADNAKTYRVGVRAGNTSGWSGWRNSPSAGPWTPDPTPTPTPAPTPDPTPTPNPPGAVGAVNVTRSHGSLNVSWSAPAGAEHYHVTYRADGGTWTLAAYQHTTNSIAITGVDNAQTYVVGVRAGNGGGWSGWRNSPSIGPLPVNPPSAYPPGPVGAITLARSGSTLTASWAALNSASWYHVTYTADGGASWSLAAFKHTANAINITIDDTNTYVVGVRAGNSAGWSGWRNSAPSVPDALDAPASVTLTHNGATLSVSWDAVTGATGYNVDVRDAQGGSWIRRAPNVSGTSMTVSSNVSPSSSYQARVQAVNGGGSPWTVSAVAHPANQPPAAPYSLSLSRTAYDTVQASWSAVPNSTGYRVDYRAGSGAWQTWNAALTATSDEMNLDVAASYAVRVRAYNANGSSHWKQSATLAPPSLSAEGFLDYTILDLANYGAGWHYKADIGPHTSCQGPLTGRSTVSGLANGMTYTYAAYDNAACTGDPLAPSATFTTLTPLAFLTVSNVEDTSATLNMNSQYPYVSWWYAPIGNPNSCAKVSGDSVSLTGLTGKTRYEYIAYSTPLCTTAGIFERIHFTTTDAGTGNLTHSLDGACSFGKPGGSQEQHCAASFTTGTSSAGGYFLHSVDVRLGSEIGWAGTVYAELHSADAGGNPAAESLATLSGTTQRWGGVYSFTCAGGGICDLSNDTTYFVVLSAPNAGYGHYRHWSTRNSSQDYRWPPSSGWSTGDGAMTKSGGGAWTASAADESPVFHVAANETAAGLGAISVTYQSAELRITGHTAAWHFKSTSGPDSSACTSVPANSNRRITSTSLDQGTYYVYTAYSDSACTTPLASTGFTTVDLTLSASQVQSSTATLTLTGYGAGNIWYYKADAGPDSSCSSNPVARSTVALTGLSAGTTYTYSAYSDSTCTAANLMETASPFTTAAGDPTLTVSNKTATSATLTVGSHSGEWWYSAGKTPYTGCSSAGTGSSVDVDNLSEGTSYTFRAYNASGCASANEIASRTFSTVGLAVSNNTGTSATLTLANRTGSWWLKETAPDTGTCTAGEADFSHALSSLVPATSYTYKAYSDSACANEIADETFTAPGVSVSNLGEANASTCLAGMSADRQCATAFTTGSSTNGYTLGSITIRFHGGFGSPSGLTVAVHAVSNSKPGSTALATLSGDAPSVSAAETRTYTCSGAGCDLTAGTTYFVVLTTPDTTGSAYYGWRLASTDNETTVPSTNGWSIANGSLAGASWGTSFGASGMMKVAATVK